MKKPDLNIEEIREILQLLKDNFVIIRYRDLEKYPEYIPWLLSQNVIKVEKDYPKICVLGHDLDNSLFSMDWALEVAELECSMGIHSSFFVLHSKWYYHQQDFIAKCKKIQDMGHEIGLHYNTIEECFNNPSLTHKMIIDRELAFLRDNGIEIHSVSAHGHTYETTNGEEICAQDIWKDFYREKVGNTDLYTLSLSDYGLYEASHHNLYEASQRKLYPTYRFTHFIADYTADQISLIKQAIRDKVDFCQVLLHPDNHIIGVDING